jgi:hypothetical protein
VLFLLYKMNTVHNIEGTLDGVEVFARRGDGSALVSRVTIDQGSYKTSIPYFGGITDDSIDRMTGKQVRFVEQEKGLLFKDVYQTLETKAGQVPNTSDGVSGLPRSDANAMLREFYPESKGTQARL